MDGLDDCVDDMDRAVELVVVPVYMQDQSRLGVHDLNMFKFSN